MLRLTVVTLVAAVVSLLLVFELLRRRRLREKYAVIWVVIALGTVVVAVFPGLLAWVSELVGIRTPSNLLFLVSLITLFAVSLQLSGEVGRLEERSRRLAEEVGALRMHLEDIDTARVRPTPTDQATGARTGGPAGEPGQADRPGRPTGPDADDVASR